MKAKDEGGVAAAQELHAQIKNHLDSEGGSISSARIMVRIYANLKGLSHALARDNLSGNESRSLAPFVAGFNRAQELFDFVDAGEKKEAADFKIRGETLPELMHNADSTKNFSAYRSKARNVNTSSLPDVMIRDIYPCLHPIARVPHIALL